MAVLDSKMLLNKTRVYRKVMFASSNVGVSIPDMATILNEFPNAHVALSPSDTTRIPNNGQIFPSKALLYGANSPSEAYSGTTTTVLYKNTAWDADVANSINTTSGYFLTTGQSAVANGYYMEPGTSTTRTYYRVTGGSGKITEIGTYIYHVYVFTRVSAQSQTVDSGSRTLYLEATSTMDGSYLALSTSNVSLSNNSIGATVTSVSRVSGTNKVRVAINIPENTSQTQQHYCDVTLTQPNSGNTLEFNITQEAAIADIYALVLVTSSPQNVTADAGSITIYVRSTKNGQRYSLDSSCISFSSNTMGATVSSVTDYSTDQVAITIAYTQNTSSSSTRACSFTITQRPGVSGSLSVNFTINQAVAVGYTFTAPSDISVGFFSRSFSVTVTSKKGTNPLALDSNCVSIPQTQMNVAITGVTDNGDGTYTFNFSCSMNLSLDPRSTILTFTQPESGNQITTTANQSAA